MSSSKIANLSLGALSRLPGELRNTIYSLAAASPSDTEVDMTHICTPSSSLLRVSKSIHAESKGFIEPALEAPCEHTHFVSVLPSLAEYSQLQYRDSLMPSFLTQNAKPHNLLQARTMRFLTAHLGTDVPLAVVVRMNLPEPFEIDIFGASARRDAKVSCDLRYLLRGIETRARKVAAGDHLLAPLEQHLMEKEIVHIGEWVREVVLDRDDED